MKNIKKVSSTSNMSNDTHTDQSINPWKLPMGIFWSSHGTSSRHTLDLRWRCPFPKMRRTPQPRALVRAHDVWRKAKNPFLVGRFWKKFCK